MTQDAGMGNKGSNPVSGNAEKGDKLTLTGY